VGLNLEIEIGRYKNKPRDERLCSGCLKVENEVNFLFECNSYLTLRDNFTNSISNKKHFKELTKYKNTVIDTTLPKFINLFSSKANLLDRNTR
jgi:hypothetical protein